MFTVGNIDFFGAGSVGDGPMPDSMGRAAFSLQAPQATAIAALNPMQHAKNDVLHAQHR